MPVPIIAFPTCGWLTWVDRLARLPLDHGRVIEVAFTKWAERNKHDLAPTQER